MKFLNMPAKRGFQIRDFWSIWGHSFRLNFIDFYDVVQLGNFCPRSPRLHTQNNLSNSRVNLSEKQLLKYQKKKTLFQSLAWLTIPVI